MTQEAQRILIAEACGWKPELRGNETFWTKDGQTSRVLNYLWDLNAMYEAEKVLTLEQCEIYVGLLCDIFDKNDGDAGKNPGYSLAHASASQRAEAFLKTIGRWI